MAEQFVLSDFLGRKMTTNKKRPFAVGFNGHANCCSCEECYRDRIKEYKKWARQQSAFPIDDDQTKTVFVNAFWRHAPRRKRQLRRLRLVG